MIKKLTVQCDTCRREFDGLTETYEISELEGHVCIICRLQGDWPEASKNCEPCAGRGFILADNSDHGLRIEKCDSCWGFPSDEVAVTFAYRIAAQDTEAR